MYKTVLKEIPYLSADVAFTNNLYGSNYKGVAPILVSK
jgi:hypothetical protein